MVARYNNKLLEQGAAATAAMSLHLTQKAHQEALHKMPYSNFSYLVELKGEHGEHTLVKYWFSMIIVNVSDRRAEETLTAPLTT
jgi:hypothetical protein